MFIVIFLICILSVLSCSVLGVALNKGKAEDFLPVSVLGIILVQYLFGLFNCLNIGFIVTLILIGAIYVLSIYLLITRSRVKEFIKAFVNLKMLLYIMMVLGLVFITYGREVSHWDEFTHWSDVVKTMFLNNCFSTNAKAQSAFMSYPPAMSLFQYYIMKIQSMVHGQQIYTEWYLYFSYLLALYSLLYSFMTKLKDREYGKIVVVALMIAIVPGLLFADVWSSIYIDPFLGIIGGFCIGYGLIHAANKLVQYIVIGMSCACLVLTKDAGLLFGIFVIAFYGVTTIYNKLSKNQALIKHSLIATGCASFGILFAKVSWKLKIIFDGATVVYDTPKIDFAELFRVILGKASENYKWDVYAAYKQSIKTTVVSLCNGWMNISYIGLMLLILCICLIILQAKRRQQKEIRTNVILIIISALTAIVYIAGMCVTYMYNFTQYEALKLASFARYQNIVFALLSVSLLVQIIDFIGNVHKKTLVSKVRFFVIALLLLCMVAPRDTIVDLLQRDGIETSRQACEEQEAFATQCKELIGSTDANVYFLAQGDAGLKFWSMRYYMRPMDFKSRGSASAFLSVDNDVTVTGIWSVNYSPEQWMDLLVEDYDYVICYISDDYLANNFSYLIDGDTSFTNMTLYQVDKENRTLKVVE